MFTEITLAMTQKNGSTDARQDNLIKHPNFDPTKTRIDPARPLTDIPNPAPNRKDADLSFEKQNLTSTPPLNDPDNPSKWQVIASEGLKAQLELLIAAQLMALPADFEQPVSSPPLIADFDQALLLDLADIDCVIQKYPALTRFGMTTVSSDNSTTPKSSASLRALIKRFDMDSRLNSDFMDDWQVILQPEDFETKATRLQDSLALDILPCSVAFHALKSCNTRQTINRRLNAEQICQFVRSYILSQAVKFPARRDYFRQLRLFSGHIIVAAVLLGFEVDVAQDGACYFNLSSRSSLFLRYPNLTDYHINGWSN